MAKLAVLVVFAALTAVGCCLPEENAAATEACKEQKSSEECSACCKEQGSNGHVYTSACSCLGI